MVCTSWQGHTCTLCKLLMTFGVNRLTQINQYTLVHQICPKD